MADTSLLESFLERHPNIEMFELVLPDVCGGLRGKWLTRDKIHKAVAGELKLPLSSLAFDVWGRDAEALVFEKWDNDGFCQPDIRTLAVVPWAKRPTAQVVISMLEATGKPCNYDTRHMLQLLMDRFSALGLTPVVASEMEFHLFEDEFDALGQPVHTQTDCVGGRLESGQTYGLEMMEGMSELMHSIREACVAQGLPIDTLIKESGPSQYEINLYHCPDALMAADQAMMLQRAIKAVSRTHGLRATFMAKPFGHLAGNGMHIHCSLVDGEGSNAFDDGSGKGTALLQQAVAGLLTNMADSMLLFAPNLNSYRRFQHGSYAPLAPCWGYENRTVSVRIPADVPAATRVEHRVAGADANPYLVIAVILAGMLQGVENKLSPAAPMQGNAYEQLEPSLPQYWPDGLSQFEQSSFIRDYLGVEFQRVYSVLKRQEMADFDRQVTPLEYEACL